MEVLGTMLFRPVIYPRLSGGHSLRNLTTKAGVALLATRAWHDIHADHAQQGGCMKKIVLVALAVLVNWIFMSCIVDPKVNIEFLPAENEFRLGLPPRDARICSTTSAVSSRRMNAAGMCCTSECIDLSALRNLTSIHSL